MTLISTIATLGLAASSVHGCLLPREIEADRQAALTGTRPARAPPTRRQDSGAFPIGTGNRFEDNSTVPVGLGVHDRDLESILNVEEVGSALRALKNGYPDAVELFEPPFKTFEGRTLPGAVIGDDPKVFIMSGIHARERGGSDNVIYFLADLLAARKEGTGVSYGGQNYTAEDVETALSAGLVVLPLTNPDGVAYDQKTDSCWRKNRNTDSASGDDGPDVGIDLNRNYDFVWDFEKAFNLDEAGEPASNDPSSEAFCGTNSTSEPETQAVVWALDKYPGITWFMDLHSFAASLLYGWGDDDVGTEDKEQNFVNSDYDGKRGATGDTEYKEYLTSDDLKTEEDGTAAMIKAMSAAGDVKYDAYQAVGLYPTSGASNDYAMGRYYGKLACDASRMFGLTLEFGDESSADPSCPFYPNQKEYHNSMRQIGAGFMEMVLLAAGPAGDRVYLEC